MTDNIKPEHYRTGEIDLFEEWYLTYPFEQYRAIMQSHAEKYLRRNKVNRVEDLDKCVETIRRLKEKEIEHAGGDEESITKDETIFETVIAYSDGGPVFKTEQPTKPIAGVYKGKVYKGRWNLLKDLKQDGFEWLARDENSELYAFKEKPKKYEKIEFWDTGVNDYSLIEKDDFPQIKWSDSQPTNISNLLATYENGGENGKVEVE